MKSKKIFLLIFVIAGLGAFVLINDPSPSNPANTGSKEKEKKDMAENTTSSNSVVVIDFPLLAEARPKDLIDMSLAFPDELQKLDGKKVSLIAFMAPFDSLEDMSRCMMVPSYVGCTFCTPPNLRQVVFVTQGNKDDETVYSFIEEPSHVTGTFRITRPDSTHEGKEQGFVYSIENAEVVPHTGEAPVRAAGHATPNGHNNAQNAAPLPSVTPTDLLREVVQMMDIKPIHSIRFEKVNDEIFGKNITDRLESTFPKSTRKAREQAFSILGLIPENLDWLDVLTGFEIGKHVAKSDPTGRRILVLETIPFNHPFVRLDVVGAIAEAIILQNAHNEKGMKDTSSIRNEDIRRAGKSLVSGVRKTVMRRYATANSISPKIPAPARIFPTGIQFPGTTLLNRWYTLPGFVGPFFIDFLVGPTGALSELQPTFQSPPTTMMEFLRPMWYEDRTLWSRDPVPTDFANQFMDTPPTLTDVLGIGGLIPWLAQPNSSYVARSIAGQWAGDRWALWEFDDGSAAMLLETRWQDEKSALEFSQSIPEHLFQWLFPHEEGSSTVRILRGSTLAALNRVDPFPK
jgi:hypothetical protein